MAGARVVALVLLVAGSFVLGRWSARTEPGPGGAPTPAPVAAPPGTFAFNLVPPDTPDVRFGPITPGEPVGPCQVRHVVDGGSLDLQCRLAYVRVKLLHTETPGFRHAPRSARRATEALKDLVRPGDVYLAFEQPRRPSRGEFSRVLAFVLAGGVNVNVEMVRQGWGRFAASPGSQRIADDFRAAEDEARSARRGFWTRGEWAAP